MMGKLSDSMLAGEYPSSPGFKDEGTSREAARRMTKTASSLREQCYNLLSQAPDGLTADEVAERLGRSVLSIRPRISELYAAGRIVKTKMRGTNVSGLSAAVYRVPKPA